MRIYEIIRKKEGWSDRIESVIIEFKDGDKIIIEPTHAEECFDTYLEVDYDLNYPIEKILSNIIENGSKYYTYKIEKSLEIDEEQL